MNDFSNHHLSSHSLPGKQGSKWKRESSDIEVESATSAVFDGLLLPRTTLPSSDACLPDKLSAAS